MLTGEYLAQEEELARIEAEIESYKLLNKDLKNRSSMIYQNLLEHKLSQELRRRGPDKRGGVENCRGQEKDLRVGGKAENHRDGEADSGENENGRNVDVVLTIYGSKFRSVLQLITGPMEKQKLGKKMRKMSKKMFSQQALQ